MIPVGPRRTFGGAAAAFFFALVLVFPPMLRAQATRPSGVWVNVTSNVGEPKWGFAGVTTMAAVPDNAHVIAGISEAGLWESSDGGKSWVKLGAHDAVPVANRPYQIVFDPKDPRTFWETGNTTGPGLFKTSDGGKTLTPIGSLTQVDGLSIDFSDPQRKTLVVGHHEQVQNIERSVDGGATWANIGLTLPAGANFTSDVLLVDANTIIASAAGWKKDAAFGLFRTADAGKTWKKVSDEGFGGVPCIDGGGAIYWQALWAKGLMKSEDHGQTWLPMPGPVKDNPVCMPNGKLLAPVDRQLMVSADGAKTWQKIGPEMPFKPTGICYSEKGKAVYAWRSTEAREDNVIIKWEMP